jgi:DNA-binding MarR family transcriptional regulator
MAAAPGGRDLRVSGDQGNPSEKSGGAGNPTDRRRAGAAPTDLGGLDKMLGYVIRRTQMWMIQDFRRALKGLDITPAQFSVLQIVRANPGVSQVRVARALAIERARLVQMIDQLQAAGHVERARSAVDRRSHALRLTAVGAELLTRAEARFEAHERNVATRIAASDHAELLRILAPFVT